MQLTAQHEVLYFGCIREPGHFLHSKKRGRVRTHEGSPWGVYIDAGILKDGKVPDHPNGTFTMTKRDGWTAVALWDRSIDPRPGSHSTFIVEADVTSSELIEMAREQWPEVFGRKGFPDLKVT